MKSGLRSGKKKSSRETEIVKTKPDTIRDNNLHRCASESDDSGFEEQSHGQHFHRQKISYFEKCADQAPITADSSERQRLEEEEFRKNKVTLANRHSPRVTRDHEALLSNNPFASPPPQNQILNPPWTSFDTQREKIEEKIQSTLKHTADATELLRFLTTAKIHYDSFAQFFKTLPELEEKFVKGLTLKLQGEMFFQVAAARPRTFDTFMLETLWLTPSIRTREIIKYELMHPQQGDQESALEFIRRLERLREEHGWALFKENVKDRETEIDRVESDLAKSIGNGLREPLGDMVRRREFLALSHLKSFLQEEEIRLTNFKFFEKLHAPPSVITPKNIRSKKTARSTLWKLLKNVTNTLSTPTDVPTDVMNCWHRDEG